MFTVNLCHFHVVHQEQKPQHCAQLLANPLQSPLTPCNTNKVSKNVHRDCHHHSHFNQSNRAPHIVSEGAINHPSSADVQQFCIIMLNTNQSLQSHATHNLQKMHAGPYPQKKDVDSIALNAYLYPLEAPTNRFASTPS